MPLRLAKALALATWHDSGGHWAREVRSTSRSSSGLRSGCIRRSACRDGSRTGGDSVHIGRGSHFDVWLGGVLIVGVACHFRVFHFFAHRAPFQHGDGLHSLLQRRLERRRRVLTCSSTLASETELALEVFTGVPAIRCSVAAQRRAGHRGERGERERERGRV